jgi:VWFA-related protein
MRRSLHSACALVIMLLGVAPASSQQTPVFRSSVDRVRVDVVVTDGNDRPITDLTRADFSITENGKAQALTDFRFVSVPVAQRIVHLSAPREAVEDVATNAPASEASRIWAIIVDDLHLIEADIVPIKAVLSDFARSLPPDDEVALIYTGRSDISMNFTTDQSRLLTAIDKVRDAVGFGLDSDPPAAQLQYTKRLAKQTADAIRNVALSLAGSAHPRRAIVYVGTMVTFDPEQDTEFRPIHLNAAFEQAKRSNVPVYTIDPRGLVQPADAVRGYASNIRRIADNIRHQQEWLHIVAINTGGRAFVNQSNLTQAVQQIVEENGSFYELAYSPDPLVRDGKFHDIDVKVNRPGVRVRARYGYVAPGTRPDAPSLPETMDAAMASGVNVSGLTMRAVATPLGVLEKSMMTAVTVDLTYPLQVVGPHRIDDSLVLTVMALDPDGKVKATVSRQLRVAGGAPDARSMSLLINEPVELPAERLTLRVGIASQQLGRAGTVQLPMDVPNASDPRLQLSGVALGVVGTRQSAMNAQFLTAVVPFQPTTSRTFAATDTLRVFGRAFWRDKAEAAVTVAIKGAPETLQQVALSALPGIKGGQQGAFDAEVPLRPLVSGSYLLVVTAQLKSGKPVVREVPFAVRKN